MEKTISPKSTWFRLWDGFAAAASFFSVMFILFLACFSSKEKWILGLSYAFDFIYLIDLVLHFKLAFYKDGILMTDKKEIIQRVRKQRLKLDLVSLLPIEIFMFVRRFPHPWYHEARLFRLNRILRYKRVLSYLGK